MKKNLFVWSILAILPVYGIMLTGCGGTKVLRDGVYSGKSSTDDDGSWGEATLTIADGNITSCDFITWQKDGSAKDEDYGKINGEISNKAYYEKAQLAVRAMKQYAEEYTKAQKGVTAVSGATISYNQFNEAVENALEKAKK
jgi:major membrane immunogen (membrane-anchored lipoprotein)